MTLFDWPVWALIVFTYVIMQRLAELVYANANTRRLLAEGGREHGARHAQLVREARKDAEIPWQVPARLQCLRGQSIHQVRRAARQAAEVG